MTIGENKSIFEKVRECYKKFGFPVADEHNMLHIIDDRLAEFRRQHLLEEIEELKTAQEEHNIIKIADALVDLVYIALGTAHFYGLPFDELFAEVHKANMKKERGINTNRSLYIDYDLIKPDEWEEPNIELVLVKYLLDILLPSNSDN